MLPARDDDDDYIYDTVNLLIEPEQNLSNCLLISVVLSG